jgi:hypothetical protein
MLRVHEGSAHVPKQANDVVCMSSLASLVSRPEFAAEEVAAPQSSTQKTTAATDERDPQFGSLSFCLWRDGLTTWRLPLSSLSHWIHSRTSSPAKTARRSEAGACRGRISVMVLADQGGKERNCFKIAVQRVRPEGRTSHCKPRPKLSCRRKPSSHWIIRNHPVWMCSSVLAISL